MSKLLTSIGLMSGTSLDGIDVALIRTDGADVVERGPSETFHYTDNQRQLLRSALKDALGIEHRDDRPGNLVEIENALTDWHAAAVQAFFAKHDLTHSNIDMIGFHGQTVLHQPRNRLTVQLGVGTSLANILRIAVVYDMRAADLAAGGQGAPLVPVYHRALASKLEKPVAFVNIGGVANVTYVGATGELSAFDTGPGNALIDDWMKLKSGIARDDGGKAALAGAPNEAAIAQFLGDSYFERNGPKSLDRNSFAGVSLEGLSTNDGAATLAAVTARAIAASSAHLPQPPKSWIICGGGRHNAAIMNMLSALLPNVCPAEHFGFNGDSMEAEAWAYLAVRCQRGLPISFPGTTGAPQPMSGGLIVSAG